MHNTSIENMQKFYDKYISNTIDVETISDVVSCAPNVAEIGSYGSIEYRNIFNKFEYTGFDVRDGPFVDVKLQASSSTEEIWKFYDDNNMLRQKNMMFVDLFDVLISGQAFEHMPYFWLEFKNMVRIVKPGGYICIIAPSSGCVHDRKPVDCYRFKPDAYQALADLERVKLIESYIDPRGEWKDCVGIFKKGDVQC